MPENYVERLFKPQQRSFFLFGPRGTGKSTLIRQVFPNAACIDLLRPDIERAYRARPERLFDFVEANSDKKQVVIDEIQKVPTLLSVVHALIEQGKRRQFILTGSSARKIKRTGADLLAGRALHCNMHPFVAAELGGRFDLNKALHHGLLPLINDMEDPTATLHTYINLYLKEEIQMEGLVRHLDDFSRFLEVISFSHGSPINASNIARECEVKRKTVENYITILEDLLLGFKVPVFSKKAQRAISVHPKFYFFDTGVFRALRPHGLLDKPEEIDGSALEGLVAQHLRAWIDYHGARHRLSFWRTQAGLEVDFIIYGHSLFWAIEVKNTKNINLKDLRGLSAFLKDYPQATAYLLYRGTEKIKEKNILCMPCETFLKGLTSKEIMD